MDTLTNPSLALLSLLQLASPALPVGAYSYSESLETLVETGIINNETQLWNWLHDSLAYGAIRIEAAVMHRSYRAFAQRNWDALSYWNAWASAAKETEELRHQSWQMGGALLQLLGAMCLEEIPLQKTVTVCGTCCNFAVAFGIAAAQWKIAEEAAMLGYLHSWASNIINAGIKLIPLGQTSGQMLLLKIQPQLIDVNQAILSLEDDDLASCTWGLSLASMNHETLYTRLFRS